MKRMLAIRPRLWWVSACVLILAACGGGSSGDQANLNPTPAMGKVGILFTDKPTDDFSQINITVDSVSLLGDEHGQIGVYPRDASDEPFTFNLLDLRQVSDLAFITDVPAGEYNKIRLHISKLELVKKDALPEDLPIDVRPPANGKIDLNPRGPFTINDGETVFVELDIDANRSFHVVQAGNSSHYRFRPVIFVNIIGMDTGRLTRIFGEVREVTAGDTGTSFVLCSQGMMSDDQTGTTGDDSDNHDCVRVFANDSGVFGDVDGTDQGQAAIVVGDPLQQLTAIGFFRRPSGDASDSLPEFDAVVIELGAQDAFLRLNGVALDAPAVVDTAPENRAFTFSVNEGQAIAAGAISTVIQPKTAIFDSLGNEFVDASAVVAGATGLVDAIQVEGGLNSALIVLDALNPDEQVLSGIVLSVDGATRTLSVQTDLNPADVCVLAEATILSVENTAEGVASTVVDFADILPEQQVDAYGSPGDTSCFDARLVIINVDAT